jgi:hypothetical protein
MFIFENMKMSGKSFKKETFLKSDFVVWAQRMDPAGYLVSG